MPTTSVRYTSIPEVTPIPASPDLPFTVGVEIEFCKADMPELSSACYRGTPWSKVPGWTLKTDGSCGWRDGQHGYELVSGILKTEADLDQVRQVVDYLNSKNAKVNEKCGLHVHIGGLGRKSSRQRNNLFNFLVRYEEAFFALAEPSRQDNRYCQRIYPSIVDGLRRGEGFAAWDNVGDSRYQWLNGAAYRKHGTLEFRIMGSTLNAGSIKGWIGLVLQVVESQINSTRNRRLSKSKTHSKEFLMHDLLQQAKCYGKHASERAVLARKWAQERFLAIQGYSYRTRINQILRAARKEKLALAAAQMDIAEATSAGLVIAA